MFILSLQTKTGGVITNILNANIIVDCLCFIYQKQCFFNMRHFPKMCFIFILKGVSTYVLNTFVNVTKKVFEFIKKARAEHHAETSSPQKAVLHIKLIPMERD